MGSPKKVVVITKTFLRITYEFTLIRNKAFFNPCPSTHVWSPPSCQQMFRNAGMAAPNWGWELQTANSPTSPEPWMDLEVPDSKGECPQQKTTRYLNNVFSNSLVLKWPLIRENVPDINSQQMTTGARKCFNPANTQACWRSFIDWGCFMVGVGSPCNFPSATLTL